MKRALMKGLITLSVMAVTVTAWSQPPEGKGGRGRGGPEHRKEQGKGRPAGFKPGTVIPPHLLGELDLTADQYKQVKDLEAEVTKKLKGILNDRQFEMLNSPPPPPGGDRDHGPVGDEPPPPGKRKDGPPRKKGGPMFKKQGPPRDEE